MSPAEKKSAELTFNQLQPACGLWPVALGLESGDCVEGLQEPLVRLKRFPLEAFSGCIVQYVESRHTITITRRRERGSPDCLILGQLAKLENIYGSKHASTRIHIENFYFHFTKLIYSLCLLTLCICIKIYAYIEIKAPNARG